MFKQDRGTRLHPRLVLGVVLLVLVFVFIVENPHQTKMRFIVPQVTAPLGIALFVAALLGALAGGLLARHIAAPELRNLRGQQRRRERAE